MSSLRARKGPGAFGVSAGPSPARKDHLQPTPPDPHFPSALLTAIAALLWQLTGTRSPDTGTPLGFIANAAGAEQYLLPASDGTVGGVTWTTYGSLPSGFVRHYLSQSTFNVIHGGTLNGDGSIAYGGTNYRVRSYFDGTYAEARAVAV